MYIFNREKKMVYARDKRVLIEADCEIEEERQRRNDKNANTEHIDELQGKKRDRKVREREIEREKEDTKSTLE